MHEGFIMIYDAADRAETAYDRACMHAKQGDKRIACIVKKISSTRDQMTGFTHDPGKFAEAENWHDAAVGCLLMDYGAAPTPTKV
jgi:hypothetical protein